MVPAASFLSIASQWMKPRIVCSSSGRCLWIFFSLWYLDNILSAVVYEDQVLSASPCLPSSSRSAVTFPGRFFPDRFTMLVRAFPNLELLAVGVAAWALPAACGGLRLPTQSWVLDSGRCSAVPHLAGWLQGSPLASLGWRVDRSSATLG